MTFKRSKGFSLVELLVVIAIIGILSVTAFVALGGQTGKARDAKRKEHLASIQQALELYFIANGNQYPAAGTLDTALSDIFPDGLPQDPNADPPQSYLYATNEPTRNRYQLAATLEGGSSTENHSVYVVGNSSSNIITANPSYRADGDGYANCPQETLENAKICTNAALDDPSGCICIPYQPN